MIKTPCIKPADDSNLAAFRGYILKFIDITHDLIRALEGY